MERTNYWKRLAKNFGRLQQNVSSDPTRKWTLLVIRRKNKMNKCAREFEVMVLKGSFTAQHKSQQSRAPAKRAVPSKAEWSGDAWNEVKTKQTHSSCHLTECRLAVCWQHSHNPKHSICTPTTFKPFLPVWVTREPRDIRGKDGGSDTVKEEHRGRRK